MGSRLAGSLSLFAWAYRTDPTMAPPTSSSGEQPAANGRVTTTIIPPRNRRILHVRRGLAFGFAPPRRSDLFVCHIDLPFLKLSLNDGFGVFQQVNSL